MKQFSFILILLSSLFLSCSKEEESAVSSSGYTALVDGNKWKASSIDASIYNNTIVVIGKASDGSTIVFSLPSDTIGTYLVDENTFSSASYILPSGKAFSSGGNSLAGGQVVIESIDRTNRKMTGSIDFDAVRTTDDSTIIISNGNFKNIPYVNTAIGLDDNSLKAKIEGKSWSPQNVSGFVAFKTLYLKAIDADGVRTLNFEIPEQIGPGNYTLNYFTKYKAVYTGNNSKKHYAINGNLEITTHNLVNRTIEGKFEMQLEAHESSGIVNFTEGEFKIIYE